MSIINLTESEKDIIGRKCCNCGSDIDVAYHHIVPTELGGKNILSNICCVCYGCHSLIHFGKNKNINHSELTKEGIKKARLNGKQIGQRKGAKLNVKKEAPAKEMIKKHNKSFGGQLTNEET